MCHRQKATRYEPADFEFCEAVEKRIETVILDQLEKTEWDGECDAARTPELEDDCIEAVHGGPDDQGGKYDNDPRV